MKIFGERLRVARKAKGYASSAELGEVLSVGNSTVSRWEAGEREPSLETIIKLAEILDVSVAYLMGETDYPAALSEKATAGNLTQRSQAAEMFANLMKKLAIENPDLIIHFRDLEKNIDKLSPKDVQAIADGIALITGKVNKDIEKRFKKAQPGDI